MSQGLVSPGVMKRGCQIDLPIQDDKERTLEGEVAWLKSIWQFVAETEFKLFSIIQMWEDTARYL